MRPHAWLLSAAATALGWGCGPSRAPFDDANTTPDAGAGMDARTSGDAGDAGPVEHCARQADCDDGFPCTDDACVIGGVCTHTTNDGRCAAGQRCAVGRGCVDANTCATSADCDDSVPCTLDLCAAGGVCQNIRDDARCTRPQHCSATLGCVDPGRCGVDRDCDDSVFCNGAERCLTGMCAAGAPMACTDGDPCTADLCSETMQMCVHPPVTPCGGNVAPGTYTVAPAAAYSCGSGSFSASTVTLTVTASGVTVTGFPATLTGPAPAMGMFSATGSVGRGGCTWRFTLSGAFTMANSFQGTWSLAFDNCDASNGCFSQFGELVGTHQ